MTSYVEAFLKALARQGNADRFYEELARYDEILMPSILALNDPTPIYALVDDRLLGHLRRYSLSGPPSTFKNVCALASCINGDVVDDVLARLLKRFASYFKPTASTITQRDESETWRAFRLLSEHPRFEHIPNWCEMLSDFDHRRLPYFYQDELFAVLSRHPASYVKIESRLIKVANFEHRLDGEVERMDLVAKTLFAQVDHGAST